MHDAVNHGELIEPFKASDVEKLVADNNIRQQDGQPYAKGYPTTLTASSYIHATNTTTTNIRCLDRRFNKEHAVYEYWFIPEEKWIRKGYK